MITSGNDFGKNIATIADKLGANVEAVAKKMIGELFKRVVERTPVDTGHLRGNWNLSINEPNTTVNESASAGEGHGAAIADEVKTMDVAGNVVYLSNGLPYAAVVEYGMYPNPPKFGSKKRGESGYAIHVKDGFSMQAPQGMVRVSMSEIEEIVRVGAEK